MTNENQKTILKAINAVNEIKDFESVEEALDAFNYFEIMRMIYYYYGEEMTFTEFFRLFEEFYKIIPKTTNELNI